MSLLALILIPAMAGLAMPLIRAVQVRRSVLVLSATVHFLITATIALRWPVVPTSLLHEWLALDDLGMLFLGITSLLFLIVSIYAVGYLHRESHDTTKLTFLEATWFNNQPEPLFLGCLLLFLSAMTAVTVSHHLGLMWVAVEATTFFSAPLIYFHKHHRSLEATWKYVLICSVGVGLALLGNFAFAASLRDSHLSGTPLVLGELLKHAPKLNPMWVKAAMIFSIVGFGTKMGLAPMHNWKPDAYSEAPSLVSALLSGALSNCAFLSILRGHQITVAAGLGAFSRELFIGFGLVSLVIAAIFMIGQTDFKRLLAYSSIEHMGILALATGLGSHYGLVLHLVNHSFAKGCLFLVAGNLLTIYQSKTISDVRGILRCHPLLGVVWIAGFLAIVGSPPFGTFLSEFLILRSAMNSSHGWIGVAFLILLVIIFLGMSWLILPMILGSPETKAGIRSAEMANAVKSLSWSAMLPPIGLLLIPLALGIFIPHRLDALFQSIAQTLGPVGGP